MNTITAIKSQKGLQRRVNVFLDEDFAFSVSRDLALEKNLRTGQTLSPIEIDDLKSADNIRQAQNIALRYLAPRLRSEAEITLKLRRSGFHDDTIQEVLSRLREQGLVNDGAFAKFWRENREVHRPRSRRLLELELRQKGVDTETILKAISEVDDKLSAYRAAQKKARSLSGLDYPSFRKRLGVHLKRRGYSFELIYQIIDQVWQENNYVLTKPVTIKEVRDAVELDIDTCSNNCTNTRTRNWLSNTQCNNVKKGSISREKRK